MKNRVPMDEARIVIDSIAIALGRPTDPSEIDAIRRMIAEADKLCHPTGVEDGAAS